ncbi:hypothetical protein BC833DRAFT_623829 [Globomyces pollinis-pini]|nr:hypothetical protein BC833DRAFT_623829 [Globomyces pollinis-pini]
MAVLGLIIVICGALSLTIISSWMLTKPKEQKENYTNNKLDNQIPLKSNAIDQKELQSSFENTLVKPNIQPRFQSLFITIPQTVYHSSTLTPNKDYLINHDSAIQPTRIMSFLSAPNQVDLNDDLLDIIILL